MDILNKIELNNYEKSHNEFAYVYRAYLILRGGLIVSNEEIINLISFFEKKEDFEICKKLKAYVK